MPNEVVMPKLSDLMTEGFIVSWEKASGDQVEPGDILAILESDGQQIGLPSFVSGILQKILIEPGAIVPVGSAIALMGLPGNKRDENESRNAEWKEFDSNRSAQARHICEAWQAVPHFAVTVNIEMEAVETFCRTFRDDGVRVTVNDFIIKACAAALLKFPHVNSSLSANGVMLHRQINIGIALSLKHGAVIPVLRECAVKSLRELARESRILMDRARKGELTPEETTGGTFTVANLGMYGIDEYLTIVRTPEAAVLAVGAVRNAPLVVDGRVVPGRVMTATLSADHRLLDGADSGLFMAELRRLLEHPAPVLLNDTE